MTTHHPLALLTPAESMTADAATIAAGTKGFTLMQRAAKAVVAAIQQRYSPQKVLVVCGSGNNGGDGFLIAAALAHDDWDVQLALLGERGALTGDAALAAQSWDGEIHPLSPALLKDKPLIVDALFGTGLARDVEGDARALIEAANHARLNVVAVDIPSGIDGLTGAVRGAAFKAALTVTFHRKKRGHVLQPGRSHAGEVLVADIGLTQETPVARVAENDPSIWLAQMPWPTSSSHKFARGQVLVLGGGLEKSGAAKLASMAALRVGAGLATIAADAVTLPVYAAAATSVMVRHVENDDAWAAAVADGKVSACVAGPGAAMDASTRQRVLATVATGKPLVLDASALSVFADNPETLLSAMAGKPIILTPHEGEFARLFPDFAAMEDKLAKTSEAAKRAGVVVVLKGSDTVIAAPDGRAVVNGLAAPFLATAGAGDVLAGMVAGLLAGGMAPFEAASAAVWIHGCAAAEIGPGMIADDLLQQMPFVLQFLYLRSQA